VKYSSNEARAGGEVRQESTAGGGTTSEGKEERGRPWKEGKCTVGGEERSFIVWESVVEIPNLIDKKSPRNSGGGSL